MTAYFGAGPIVKALEMGADIVVTGRTADSSMALAPCVHNLKWDPADFDKMAMGSLAGDALTSLCILISLCRSFQSSQKYDISPLLHRSIVLVGLVFTFLFFTPSYLQYIHGL